MKSWWNLIGILLIHGQFEENRCLFNTDSSNAGDWQTFYKDLIVNILGFAAQTVSAVTTLLLYNESSHREYANGWVWPCSNTTLFIKRGNGPDLTVSCNLLTPVLIHKRLLQVLSSCSVKSRNPGTTFCYRPPHLVIPSSRICPAP